MLPLRCSGRLSASWSPPPAPGSSIVDAFASMLRVSPTFHNFRCVPIGCLSPSRVPGWIEAIHLLSIRSRRVNSTVSSGMHTTPVSFRLSQRPLASIRHQAPLSIAVRRHRGCFLIKSGSAELSPAFAGSHSVVFILAETRPLIEASRHYFRSFGPMSSDRVLGMHATPIPPGGKVPPGRHHPAPGSYCDVQRFPVGPFA
jgi:hypothetical protein